MNRHLIHVLLIITFFTQARLQLVRDFTSRISTAAMFVKGLETVTMEEYSTWHKVGSDWLGT